MQAKTHITTTLALGLPLMSLTNELTLVNVGVLAVGSLLPDIDHPSSYLGKRHKMVSGVTNKAFWSSRYYTFFARIYLDRYNSQIYPKTIFD